MASEDRKGEREVLLLEGNRALTPSLSRSQTPRIPWGCEEVGGEHPVSPLQDEGKRGRDDRAPSLHVHLKGAVPVLGSETPHGSKVVNASLTKQWKRKMGLNCRKVSVTC